MKKNIIYILFCFLAFISACGVDDTSDSQPTDSYDRGALLLNWADNIIIPGYANLSQKLNALEIASEDFTQAPAVESLEVIRNAWLEAYKAFQKISMFEIGRAETLNYRNRLNVYPTNAQEIDGYISSNTWNLELPSTIDSQGFPAIDYLLYGLGTDQETLNKYTTDENASSYKMYLLDLVTTMQTLTNEVISDWQNGYRDSYVTNVSSSASGAVDQTVNAFMFYYEKALRAGKVGIPAGVFSGSTLPQNVESYYNQFVSKLLLTEALSATKSFFNGEGFSGNGYGLNTYLDTLGSVKDYDHDEDPNTPLVETNLSTIINNQFDVAFESIDLLQENFVQQIADDNTKMLGAYDELQRNVVLLKVDMFQALSIDVTYVDADGD
jgi:hypothetical protein